MGRERATPDRLGWAAQWSLSAFGATFGVRTNRPEIWPQLEMRLPLGSRLRSKAVIIDPLFSLRICAGRRNYHQLHADDTLVVRSKNLDEVLDRLESEMRLTVAATSPRRVFVHAGAVAVDGVGVLLPGRSFHGKSTLVAALLRAGATYYSDEYAVLDRQGRLHPYSIPVSLRIPGTQQARRVTAESLGAPTGRRPISVGLVIETAYHPKGRWRPDRLSSGQAALSLLRDTVTARQHPALSLATVRLLAEHASAYRSSRGDADEVARWILNFITQKGAELVPTRTSSRAGRRVDGG